MNLSTIRLLLLFASCLVTPAWVAFAQDGESWQSQHDRLSLQRKETVDELGSGHPTVKKIDSQIAAIQELMNAKKELPAIKHISVGDTNANEVATMLTDFFGVTFHGDDTGQAIYYPAVNEELEDRVERFVADVLHRQDDVKARKRLDEQYAKANRKPEPNADSTPSSSASSKAVTPAELSELQRQLESAERSIAEFTDTISTGKKIDDLARTKLAALVLTAFEHRQKLQRGQVASGRVRLDAIEQRLQVRENAEQEIVSRRVGELIAIANSSIKSGTQSNLSTQGDTQGKGIQHWQTAIDATLREGKTVQVVVLAGNDVKLSAPNRFSLNEQTKIPIHVQYGDNKERFVTIEIPKLTAKTRHYLESNPLIVSLSKTVLDAVGRDYYSKSIYLLNDGAKQTTCVYSSMDAHANASEPSQGLIGIVQVGRQAPTAMDAAPGNAAYIESNEMSFTRVAVSIEVTQVKPNGTDKEAFYLSGAVVDTLRSKTLVATVLPKPLIDNIETIESLKMKGDGHFSNARVVASRATDGLTILECDSGVWPAALGGPPPALNQRVLLSDGRTSATVFKTENSPYYVQSTANLEPGAPVFLRSSTQISGVCGYRLRDQLTSIRKHQDPNARVLIPTSEIRQLLGQYMASQVSAQP